PNSSVITNVARKQPTDIMDPEDLEQELWVFYLEELLPRDYPEGAVVDLIKKQAAKTARQERIDYMQFRGAFIYSPAVVRTILEDAVWVDAEDAPRHRGAHRRVERSQRAGNERPSHSAQAVCSKPERAGRVHIRGENADRTGHLQDQHDPQRQRPRRSGHDHRRGAQRFAGFRLRQRRAA